MTEESKCKNILHGIQYYLNHNGNDLDFINSLIKSVTNEKYASNVEFHFIFPTSKFTSHFKIEDIEFVSEPQEKIPFLFFEVRLKSKKKHFFCFKEKKLLHTIYSQILDLQIAHHTKSTKTDFPNTYRH